MRKRWKASNDPCFSCLQYRQVSSAWWSFGSDSPRNSFFRDYPASTLLDTHNHLVGVKATETHYAPWRIFAIKSARRVLGKARFDRKSTGSLSARIRAQPDAEKRSGAWKANAGTHSAHGFPCWSESPPHLAPCPAVTAWVAEIIKVVKAPLPTGW